MLHNQTRPLPRKRWAWDAGAGAHLYTRALWFGVLVYRGQPAGEHTQGEIGMAGLWRDNRETPEGKYPIVLRCDD